MNEDWAADVRRYVPDADEGVIAGIIRYCGIALQSRDASLVSFSDPAETGRVRENFLKKKLGLTLADDELDAAIARVGERMSGDATRNRVTVYYLLADMFGKLGLFETRKAAADPEPAAQPASDPEPAARPSLVSADPPPAPEPVRAAAMPPPPPAPEPVRAAAVPPPPRVEPVAARGAAAVAAGGAAAAATARRRGGDDGLVGTALLALGAMGLIILFASTVGSLVGTRLDRPAAPVLADTAMDMAAAPAAAPAPAAPAVPEGMGVLAEEVDGRPKVSVYFDTAKADVAPDFASVAAPIKAYLDANPGARLAVSGYNDPRGDPAFNAELSKNRAQNVKAALMALGVPEAAIDLEKPADTTDTSTSFEQARRVDIMVRDAG
jgi:outer membrane protein OmpA-like peptidoglycan-associated protein